MTAAWSTSRYGVSPVSSSHRTTPYDLEFNGLVWDYPAGVLRSCFFFFVPDVDLLGAELFADDFGRHPGVGSDETHLDADVVPGAASTEVADLDHVVIRQEDAAMQRLIN